MLEWTRGAPAGGGQEESPGCGGAAAGGLGLAACGVRAEAKEGLKSFVFGGPSNTACAHYVGHPNHCPAAQQYLRKGRFRKVHCKLSDSVGAMMWAQTCSGPTLEASLAPLMREGELPGSLLIFPSGASNGISAFWPPLAPLPSDPGWTTRQQWTPRLAALEA